MSRILARATLETQRAGIPGISHSAYRVTVTGKTMLGRPLPDRIYDVEANDQDQAAESCLRLYEQEFDPPLGRHTLIH